MRFVLSRCLWNSVQGPLADRSPGHGLVGRARCLCLAPMPIWIRWPYSLRSTPRQGVYGSPLRIRRKDPVYVPKKHRAKLDARWRYEIFLGRASNCDQNYIGLPNGSIVAARAIVRLVPSIRWNMERLGLVRGTRMDFKTKDHDSIEEEVSPHAHPEDQEDGELAERENRRMQISDSHLRKYGFTGGCRICELHKQG